MGSLRKPTCQQFQWLKVVIFSACSPLPPKKMVASIYEAVNPPQNGWVEILVGMTALQVLVKGWELYLIVAIVGGGLVWVEGG